MPAGVGEELISAGFLFFTVYCKKSTVHYIGKNKRSAITDNIYIVCPLGGIP